MAAITAFVTSSVVARPPRSGVSTSPLAATDRRFLAEEVARWRPIIQAAGQYAD